MKPLVSILIPAHNAERWIADTICSAADQTWERKEIIVVDDGSTDRTLDIARQFESESVHVVSQKKEGAATARNKAFSLSQGDYIQWLDADDLLAPDKIETQMRVLDQRASRRTLLSGAWAHFMYRPYRARFTPTDLWCDLSPAEFLRRKLEQGIFMQTAVWLISRELTKAAGPWDTRLSYDDDGEYFSRVQLASDGIRFVPEARVYYRAVGTVRLSYIGGSSEKLESFWRSMKLHIQYLRSVEDSQCSRAACVRYLQNYLATFDPLRPDIVQQMYEVATILGGQLEAPRLSWKYSWIKGLAGFSCAKHAQVVLPRYKWLFLQSWDKLALSLETKKFFGARDIQNTLSKTPQLPM